VINLSPTQLRIAASYIGLSWNNARQAGNAGLHGLTMSTQQTARMLDRPHKAVLVLPMAAALWFLNWFAFQYLEVNRDRFGIYWPRHEWLFVHIVAGMLALLLGPVQLWLLGGGYALGVLVSASAAFYLARHTDFGWVFGMGLTAMSVAWIVSTTFATIAICRHLIEQHREWMIRSYVLTFGFVTFRLLTLALQLKGIGTTLEQMTAASWFSWSVPLLITEWLIQGRKVLAVRKEKSMAKKTQRETTHIQLEIFDRASL
jgi:hypothetical protein